ncbi:MAG: FecR family protein [Deltaproteobacteria bacterium]|nr:FecR family protein [Deltaproteobacteria bacterium]
MSDRPSFVAALREADAAHEAERLRPGAVHRITRRMEAELLQTELPARRRTWIPMVTFAAGAAMVLGVFALSSGPETAVHTPDEPIPMHAAWSVGGDNCHATSGEAVLVLDGSCRVEPPGLGLVIDSRTTTQLRATNDGVALLGGVALFEVDAATEGRLRRVEVPGGTIEVVGTRFAVVVNGDRGHVDLLEGTIHFVTNDGEVHDVAPGERYHFTDNQSLAVSSVPQPPEDEAPLAAGERLARRSSEEAMSRAAGELLEALGSEPADAKATRSGRGRDSRRPSAAELRSVVEQVTELRARRQYRAAVSLLRGALAKPWDRHTREVLSYELGTILSTQLSDHDKACAHWKSHRKQFTAGRYERAITRATQRLGCEG